MASKQIRITDSFQESICGICGCEAINQYFGVNDNFIEYCGVYFSFREVLSESLSIQINHNSGKSIEMCLDCKDKVIKFYHFKRRVKEAQEKKTKAAKSSSKISEKRSKIVHNIYDIIENYAEKCSVSTIRVNQSSKKLIIESESVTTEEEAVMPSTSYSQSYESDMIEESAISIKDEPLETLSENYDYNSEDIGTEEDSYSNSDYMPEQTTSYRPNEPAAKKSKKEEIEEGSPSGRNVSKTDSAAKLMKFQKIMFSGRITGHSNYFRVVRLEYAEAGSQLPKISQKFHDSEFKTVKRFQVECKDCLSKLWAQIRSTYNITRHIDVCQRRNPLSTFNSRPNTINKQQI